LWRRTTHHGAALFLHAGSKNAITSRTQRQFWFATVVEITYSGLIPPGT
jgi:hypothetical protein